MKAFNILKYMFILSLLWTSSSTLAKTFGTALSEIHTIDNHNIHVATWGDVSNEALPWVVKISGPIDSWHSDSAWFAANGPLLATAFRVLAIDRAGQINELDNAPVGYQHFATDLQLILQKYAVKNATLVAFASSNISAQIFFNEHTDQQAITRALLIDPDVLTSFSIKRYASDAQPFKENLSQYLDYIGQGKYTQRVTQKNAADMKLLQTLSHHATTDWQYVKTIFDARLKVNNQLNLFREIARYETDLMAAANTQWPEHIPTVIVDTQFESKYIENTDDAKAKEGLIAWQNDAKTYYQMLAKLNSKNVYIEAKTQAHLFQFEQPETVKKLIVTLQTVATN